MGQALYRKYRSKSLGEIVGQEHITETLQRAIAADRIAHAYLFTGPRGVGKTSIARILAHELNSVPYTDESSHLDIIEIDAASNGGVEEVRDLRDKVHIAPSSGKYKVYIIDEVHMMTTPAFNALLKTLEEPPAHAVFILATTEAHKLPATIISRTQRFTFKPVPSDKVTKHLRYIAAEEHIDITDEALALIAEHSEGSFRDSIGMLDQAGSAAQPVDRAAVEQLLGIPAAATAGTIIRLLAARDMQGLVGVLTSLRTSGYQASAIARLLGGALRSDLLGGSGPLARRQSLALLGRLIDVPASHHPDQLLEIVLLEAALSDEAAPTAETATVPADVARAAAHGGSAAPAKAAIPTPPVTPVMHVATAIAMPPPVRPHQQPAAAPGEAGQSAASMAAIDDAQWQAVLAALRKQYNTLYGIIRMARPEFLPGAIRLTFGFAFHQKRANDTKNKQLLMAVLENATGQRVAIECLFDRTVTPPAPLPAVPAAVATAAPAPAAAPALEAISAIFGGGEVLGS